MSVIATGLPSVRWAESRQPPLSVVQPQAAAKVDARSSKGMDEIETPAFLRKQAD